jgi:F-type H+-transporting ATPase subunit delta
VSSEQTETSGVAGRYATALFELAVDRGVIDEVANDLRQLQAMINKSADLRRLIQSPLFSRAQQSDAMAAVLNSAGLSELVRNFIGVVAGNRRLFALEGMIGAYRGLVAQHRGEVTAEITSATPLSEAQRSAVEQALKQAIGSNVAIDIEIDLNLIGGMVVRVGSRMVDSSLRTKLQRLQLAMKGAA